MILRLYVGMTHELKMSTSLFKMVLTYWTMMLALFAHCLGYYNDRYCFNLAYTQHKEQLGRGDNTWPIPVSNALEEE